MAPFQDMTRSDQQGLRGPRSAAWLLLWAMPCPALAAAAPPSGSLVQLLLGLIAVLAVIVGGAWLLKRTGRLPGAAQGALHVLGGVSLGPRERAVLVQVGDTQLLVGVAPGRIQTLHVLERPAVTVPAEHGGAAAAAGGGFSERLAAVLRAGRSP